MFRRIVVSACLAGLLGGLVLTGVQWFQVVPIIAQAEIYERAGTVPKTHSNGSDHDHAAWALGEGGERTLWTAIANVGMAIGFALLLAAIFSLRENVTWRQGLLWGLGGFAAFFALPAIGLAPELPGTATAALEQRQVWWVMTVAMSAAGLALAALGRSWALKAVGVVLVLAPHAVGAPQPETHSALAPSDLAQTFVFATALANAVFWLVLGAGSAIAFKKLA